MKGLLNYLYVIIFLLINLLFYRLASSLLSQQQRTSPTTQTPTANTNNDKLQPVTPEIQSSIKEVTSAIVHYVNDQTNQQRSRSTSPNSR